MSKLRITIAALLLLCPLALPRTYAEVLRLPSTVEGDAAEPAAAVALGLDDFETIALQSHPSLSELHSRIRAARCAAYQAGLPPNPTVGYVAEEMGDDGSAGQQGMYVGQKFIRGGKLELDRAVLCRESTRLEQELSAQHFRVRTRVRTAFYDTLIAQREVEVARQLVDVSGSARETAQRLLEAQEARKADVLQAEVEYQKIHAQLRQSQFAYLAAWRRLAIAVGQPEMPEQPIDADLAGLRWEPNWEETYAALLAGSPEVAEAMSAISKAQAQWRRERAEPIPDVSTQLSVRYNDASDDTIASVQVGVPLPLWNRNQGGVGAASHRVAAARRRLEAIELRLSDSLAQQFRQYQAADAVATTYRDQVLRRAEENLQLIQQAYAAGEASYLDLLTVQRTYFQTSLDYLSALRQVNASVQLLSGYLLGS